MSSIGLIARSGVSISAISIFAAVIGLYLAAVESRTANQTDLADQSRIKSIRFATDDHRVVVDAQRPPYSALGKFKGTMTCTASIVLHPRIIITASHCLTKRNGRLELYNLLFEPGYQAGGDLGQFKATLWMVGSEQSFKRESVQEASQDWAILVLDHAPAGVQPFLLGDQSLEILKSLRRQILMPSYSIDVANAERIGLDTACSIFNAVWNVLVHDCRASFGSSGAPLLMRSGQQYAIVGIHTGSMYASDDKGGVGSFIGNRAISSEVFADELLRLSRRLQRDSLHDASKNLKLGETRVEGRI